MQYSHRSSIVISKYFLPIENYFNGAMLQGPLVLLQGPLI